MAVDELVLDPVPEASRAARRWVVNRLHGLAYEQMVDTAELLTAEVVTNAILHAGTPVVVRVHLFGGGVRVEVADRSSTEPSRRHQSAEATIGRGLWMLDQLAQEWSWSVTDDGKVVWFVLSAGDGSAATEPAAAAVPAGPRRRETGLGRYGGEAHGDGVRVCLLGLPVQLLVASQEHHDTLLRELRLMALADPASAADQPQGLTALVQELGVRYAANRARRDREIQDALARGLLQIDQEFEVPREAGAQMRHVADLLAEADRYCAQNLLLTLQRPALVRRFADWYLGQVVNQIDGRPAERWTGPLTASGA